MAGNTTTVTTTSSGMSDADFEAFFESRGYIRLYALAFGCGMALIVFIGSILSESPARALPMRTGFFVFFVFPTNHIATHHSRTGSSTNP